jgi:glycosyltransferase involved in cell wall biosynthesis
MIRTASTKSGQSSSVPPLSVVMPAHNALPYLDEAVESILGQTFPDFEFVILDDGSTDGSGERLLHWASQDPRIRLLTGERRLGPVGSSNTVARAARARIVARMDADDISYPDRLREQMELLRQHADVGLVASVSDMIDAAGRKIREPEIWRLAVRSPFVPFAHGSIMYRQKLFEQIGGYRRECEYWEDQDLVVRMAAESKVAVIPHALYRIRQWTTSTRAASKQERLEDALNRVYRATDLIRSKRSYDDLLQTKGGSSDRVDPRVFVALGSIHLWAGDKPRILKRMLSRARLSWDVRTIATIVWTVWASANSSSLRWFLKALLRARNELALRRLPRHGALLWRPLEDVQPLEPGQEASPTVLVRSDT